MFCLRADNNIYGPDGQARTPARSIGDKFDTTRNPDVLPGAVVWNQALVAFIP